jgi:hypothetical protein
LGRCALSPPAIATAKSSIAISSTIKPSKLIAPTTAGHQTLPSRSRQQRLPQEFLMTVKAPRCLTHSKHLYSPEKWLEPMSEGLQSLGARLGTLLVQLSPQFGCDSARLAYFLQQMPLWIKVAVEFRHPRWHTEEVFSLWERSLCGLLRSFAGRTFRLPCV